MRNIPEQVDLEELIKACDKVRHYLNTRCADDETQQAIALICGFVWKIKPHIDLIEKFAKKLKEDPLK